MATLGSGNDNPNIDGGVTSFVDFGGNDTYTILPSLSADVSITDNQASTINLPEGIEISAANFSANGVQFTVNGFTVTLIGNPSLFTFVFGGTPLDVNAGTQKTFAETAVAFGTTVPAEGDPLNAATQTGTVSAAGTVGQTLAIATSANSVNEGASFDVSVTGADANSTVAYTITGVDAADVDALTGTITTDANGSGSATVAALADKTTEGAETLTVSLDGTAVSADVVINDTSVAPTSTLTVSPAAASVNEGGTAVFNVQTTGVAEGTTVSYVVGGNAADSANADDITGPLTGTATVGADGKASISVAVTSDNVTEGPETLTITAAAPGDLSATASTVINDTSKSPENLTTADDTLTGGAGDDAFTGTAASLSSERTLNTNDKIDGGAGNDTLNVEMKGAFGGFSSTGFLKNVENVNLTNTGTIPREFDASGATGVQTYKLSGNVSLRDLDSATTGVTVENRDSGAVSVAYVNDALKGDSDTFALGVNGVGTAEVPASTGVTGSAEKAVTINATSNTGGFETAAITSSGTSFINLGTNVGTKAITASGTGSLAIRDVVDTVKTFDGSAASANLAVTFKGTSDLTSIKGGSGSDTFAVESGNLLVNTTIEGGDGQDTLGLTGQSETLQLSMSGVETIGLAGAGSFTYSATNTSGVEKISTSASGGDVTIANLGGVDLAYDLNGTSAGKITADHSGTASINVIKPASDATNDKATKNTTEVILSKAGQVSLTVDDKMDFNGKITATEATAVTAAIKGQMSADATTKAALAEISAGKAQSVVISEVTGGDTAVKIDAAAATSVQVSNAKALDLSGSTLSKVESFSSNGTGAITTGDLGAANQVTVENTGKATIGAVGSATQDYSANVTVSGAGETTIGAVKTQNQAVNISANNLTGDFTVASIAAGSGDVNVTAKTTGKATLGGTEGKNINVNFVEVLNDVTATVTGSTANITGSSIAKNAITATADTLTVSGGILVDNLTLAGNSAGSSNKVTNTLNITTDLGDDVVNYTTNAADGLTTTLTGTVNLGSGDNDTFKATVAVGSDKGAVNASGLTVTGAKTVTIEGNNTANTLVGTAGDDIINPNGVAGGPVNGRDVMAGLGGKDTINATGASVDEIHFRSIDGSDTINGFNFNEDKIHFLDNGTTGGAGAVNFAAADGTGGPAGTDFVLTDEGVGSAFSYREFDRLDLLAAAHDANAAGTNESNKVLVINDDEQKAAVEAFTEAGLLNAYLVVDDGNNALVYFDADWGTTGDRSLVATLVNAGAFAGAELVGVDVTDFGVYTTVA